jgi:hypothetical protein
MRNCPFLLALALSALAARGEDITNNGRVYFNVALLTNRCDAGGITFSHKAGVARIDFMDLGAPDQARFGFDPARYSAFKEEEAKRREAAPPVPAPPPGLPSAQPPPQPAAETRIIRRTVIITNAPAPFAPLSSSPVTTLGPDNDKMNATRLKAIQKAMEINSANRKR